MKISYTGRHEAFPPKARDKFETKLQKLSKMLDRRGEKEAHVILTQERFLHNVEIRMNAWDHAIVGVGSDTDLVLAANDALEKLEKQVLKLRNKWRDTKRHKDKEAEASAPVPPPLPAAAATFKKAAAAVPAKKAGHGKGSGRKRIFRVDHNDGSKPMTVEEAMLEMEESQDYMVYRDAQTDRISVLMRRPDGNFDLIES
ncbi:MAG TPA: ribosome-associated translation inhibitor RaiA [Bryobacteraceae bacterium]|nr:ribosome-associated translation inhibitor RaiA [Bryobacteraceae bacterium]